MALRKTKRKNNIQLVKGIMEYSQYGALAQIMVMQGIQHFIDLVIETEDELIAQEKEMNAKGKHGLIHMPSWIGVAKEIKAKIEENHTL